MLCAPHLVPIAEYLTDRMSSRPWCYWAFSGSWSLDHGGRYVLSVVIEREAGHFPTGSQLMPLSPLTLTRAACDNGPDNGLEMACLEARWINRDRGIADRETDRIVASMLGADHGRGERLI